MAARYNISAHYISGATITNNSVWNTATINSSVGTSYVKIEQEEEKKKKQQDLDNIIAYYYHR